ncbi:MAG: prepilin peptidase [Candidatus Gastranaerophilales bacterium]|nr:prepilin peptidase [Candidatus Gastranaerophilales bacterium]
MDSFWWVLISILGLCYGSFINVLIVRSLSNESIILPPSKCPKCQTKLLWWQKIPIFSYFYLKGKCYFCNTPISIQYPIIELAGMGLFIFAFATYPSLFDAISVIGILSMFLTLAMTDIKEQKISTVQMLIIMLLGVIFNRYDIFNALLGGLVGASLIVLLTTIGLKAFNKETFGVGDIYLLGALGTVVGLDKLFLYIIYALFIQVIFVLPDYIMTLWRNEQSETLKYLIIFIITCLFLYVSRNVDCWGAKPLFTIALVGMLFLTYKLTKNLIGILKNQETQSYCPLAPAIAVSCLLFLL